MYSILILIEVIDAAIMSQDVWTKAPKQNMLQQKSTSHQGDKLYYIPLWHGLQRIDSPANFVQRILYNIMHSRGPCDFNCS